MEQIPVISINLSGLEKNPGFKLTPQLLIRGVYAAFFGDVFMRCVLPDAALRAGEGHHR